MIMITCVIGMAPVGEVPAAHAAADGNAASSERPNLKPMKLPNRAGVGGLAEEDVLF